MASIDAREQITACSQAMTASPINVSMKRTLKFAWASEFSR
jgi:hypothetical protein